LNYLLNLFRRVLY